MNNSNVTISGNSNITTHITSLGSGNTSSFTIGSGTLPIFSSTWGAAPIVATQHSTRIAGDLDIYGNLHVEGHVNIKGALTVKGYKTLLLSEEQIDKLEKTPIEEMLTSENLLLRKLALVILSKLQ